MSNQAATITLSLDELRLVGLWAADCAEGALPLFEAKAPLDARPREAIEGIRVFARGGQRMALLRSQALAAHASAREVGDLAASAAARSAGHAAATAYTHPLATLDQAKHVLCPAVYAARAREIASNDPDIGEAEIRRAIEHASLIVREVMRRFPSRALGRTRLDALFYHLDAGLRG